MRGRAEADNLDNPRIASRKEAHSAGGPMVWPRWIAARCSPCNDVENAFKLLDSGRLADEAHFLAGGDKIKKFLAVERG